MLGHRQAHQKYPLILYRRQMYEQLKQETLRLGEEIDRQVMLCRELANTPKRYQVYQKSATHRRGQYETWKKESLLDDKQKQTKLKEFIEEIDEQIIKRVKQKIQSKLKEDNQKLQQQLTKMKDKERTMEASLKQKADIITQKQIQIQRITKEHQELLKKQEDLKKEEQALYHCKSEEEINSFDYQQQSLQTKEKRTSLNQLIRKKSCQSQNFLSKAICNKLAMPSRDHQGERQCHTQRDQIQTPHEIPTPPLNLKQDLKQQQNGEKSLSVQNNPDSEVNLSYQELKEKYRQLCLENEKMAEYLCMLHNLNHKWKKGTTEIQHHSKINVLAQLSQNLSNIFHKDQTLTVDNYEAVMLELTNLIKDLQNYIHFLDHLVKIQPFQEHYRSPYHLKRLTKKFDPNLKLEKQIIAKKTYSEGCSREDQLIENFDIYPYQPDEIPIPQHEEPMIKEKQKKDFYEFQKFGVEENKELFSQISSVKNQSQWSQISSFINSKSELEQLGKYLKNHKNFEESDDQYTLKKDSADKTKIELKSFNQLRQLCLKLKDQNEQLLRQRGNYDKMCRKEIQRLQHEHTKKINKITKEFNESFGLLCQRTGLHKEKQTIKSTHHKQVQAEPPQMQVMRKRSHTKTEADDTFQRIKLQNMIDNATQDLQAQIKEKEEKNKELKVLLQKNKESLKELNQRVSQMEDTIEKLHRMLNNNKIYEEKVVTKINKDLSEFIIKVAEKNKSQIMSLNQLIPQKSRAFRKNSGSIDTNSYLVATKITEIKIKTSEIFNILSSELNIQVKELNQNITQEQLRKLVKISLESLRRKSFKELLAKIKEKLDMLLGATFDDWCQQLQEYRMALEEYFDPSDQVSHLFTQINEMITKIRTENADEYGSLSVNSRVVEQELISKSRNPLEDDEQHMIRIESKYSQEEYKKKLEQTKINCQTLKNQNGELLKAIQQKQQTIRQLEQEITRKTSQLENSIKFNPLQEVIKEKEKEIIGLQQQILALRDQATKLKSKSKRPKVFHIQG